MQGGLVERERVEFRMVVLEDYGGSDVVIAVGTGEGFGGDLCDDESIGKVFCKLDVDQVGNVGQGRMIDGHGVGLHWQISAGWTMVGGGADTIATRRCSIFSSLFDCLR